MVNAWEGHKRLGGLRRFAIAITALNGLGHTVLGFEQSYAQPLVALAAAYATELFVEFADARARGRTPRYAGGVRRLVDFLLSAHITGLAVSMLLYANDRLAIVAFAAAVGIASKALWRVPAGQGTRHVLNPSNCGITATLLLFPWVGIAPPYQFTENLRGAGDWVLPAVIIVSGTFLNVRFTERLPLIAAWLTAFALQAAGRGVLAGTPVVAGLLPMTGVAFILFTFYMITDPATSPSAPRTQIAFGVAVAAAYGALVASHQVFGLFFALTIVTAARGLYLYLSAKGRAWAAARAPLPPEASMIAGPSVR